jgi:DNA-damage-inducible protein D
MENKMILELINRLDSIVQYFPESNVEFWYARELMEYLGYDRWENFSKVIERAINACKNSGIQVENHFRGATKMVRIGSGAERQIDDIMLTRYACYLIAQNGDPRKEQIAFAQTYFAVQTRKLEIIEERIRLQDRIQARQKLTESETELSKNIYERGLDSQGFGRIRSKGDQVLFGGNTTQAMKNHLGVPSNRPLADFLPTITIAAKNLETEMTNHNVSQNDLYGELNITNEHTQNNHSVRNMLVDRGIKPEKLPPEEDIKKLERRINSVKNKLIKKTELPKNQK